MKRRGFLRLLRDAPIVAGAVVVAPTVLAATPSGNLFPFEDVEVVLDKQYAIHTRKVIYDATVTGRAILLRGG